MQVESKIIQIEIIMTFLFRKTHDYKFMINEK